ncbi:MAG: hydroxymethylglutaryl-CoA lyase [Alphaproteobacteria bacterium]
MTRVIIREVGMRDGLQSIAANMATADKCAWIDAEHGAGVDEIEVCSFVPVKLLPQFADAEEVVKHALGRNGLTVAALTPNLRGAERGFALGVHKLNFVVSVSEAHNLANVRRPVAESVADFRAIVAARNALPGSARPVLAAGLSTSFGCSIAGAVSPDAVVALAGQLLEAGAEELVVADTVGYANPAQVRAMFSRVLREAGRIPVAAHFHDTRGLGLANALAALDVGVTAFDASLGGFGGCPYAPGASGNVATEDLAFMLDGMGVETGIDIERLLAARAHVERALPGTTFFGALARAGLPKGHAARRAA